MQPGDRVRLLRLEEAFLAGLDADVAARLKGLIGRTWTVETLLPEFGVVEIVYCHSAGSTTPLEWISVPPSWIER